MTARAKVRGARRMHRVDPGSVAAAAVNQMREWEAKEHDRIITAVTGVGKDFKEFRFTTGGTLETLMKMTQGLTDKIGAFDGRLTAFEKHVEARIARIERDLERLKTRKPGDGP